MRETLIRPLGLVTQPNEYGQYPAGALSRADNWVMRSPGILSRMQAHTWLSQGLVTPGTYTGPRRLHSTRAQLIAFLSRGRPTTFAIWIKPDGTHFSATFEDPSIDWTRMFFGENTTHPQITPILFRSRTIVPTVKGPIAADYADPSTTAERMFRWAGLPQPGFESISNINGGTGQAVKLHDVVTYAVTVEREYPDGYRLISEPSPLTRFKSNHDDSSVLLLVNFGPPAAMGMSGYRNGDIVKIWRSLPVQSDGINLNTDSGTTLYLAKQQVLTLSPYGSMSILDDSEPTSLTEELYTNPGQESLGSARRRPPQSRCMASFGGVAFYGNVTSPPRWLARVPGGLGLLAYPGWTETKPQASRARGVGVRKVVGFLATGDDTTVVDIDEASMVGLVVGQEVYGNLNSVSHGTIVSITPAPPGGTGSITVSGSLADEDQGPDFGVAIYTVDVIEIDGIRLLIPDLQWLLRTLAGDDGMGPLCSDSLRYCVTTGETVAYLEYADGAQFAPAAVQLVFNQSWIMEPCRYSQQATLTVRGTHGENYDPPIPQLTEAAQVFTQTPYENISYYSWDQQPEAVAPPNYIPVGTGKIYAMVSTLDALYFFCSDGLHRLTGYMTRSSGIGAQWRVDTLDRTLVIADAHAYCVLRDVVYAYTNRGLVAVTKDGVQELTTGIVGDILPGARWSDDRMSDGFFLAADLNNDEVWLGSCGDAVMNWIYIYNARHKAFTRYAALDSNVTRHLEFFEPLSSVTACTDQFNNAVSFISPSETRYYDATADFQPIHADDPLLAKQWIDTTIIGDSKSVGTLVCARFNGYELAAHPLAKRPNDTRKNFGVPRRAPAVGHTLAPGIRAPGNLAQDIAIQGIPLVLHGEQIVTGAADVYPTQPLNLLGISLRFEALSEQAVFR